MPEESDFLYLVVADLLEVHQQMKIEERVKEVDTLGEKRIEKIKTWHLHVDALHMNRRGGH